MIKSVKVNPSEVLFTCAVEVDCATAKGHVDMTANMDDIQKLTELGLSINEEPRAVEINLLQSGREERLQQVLSESSEVELSFSFDFDLTGKSSIAVTASTLVVDHDEGVTRYVDVNALKSQPGVTVCVQKS
jgi:hypothetical protein